MSKFLIVANWKANLPVKYDFMVPENLEVAIAAPFPYLSQIPNNFTRVSQDISAFPVGAYTGEIPAKLLLDLNVKYCLVGHSERRKYLKETNLEVEAKIKQAIENNIIPIICAQALEEIPANIRNYPADKFMIMYEPFSAISTNGDYHSEDPQKINAVLSDWKTKLNLNCRFLYGGSINPENCKLYIVNCKLISGFVVGHAALNNTSFSAIIKKCLPN